ncbi:MAG TPA: IS1634 family transposase [Candidatus Sulfotelmatobacter sp.]|nr:IS1634 family transposase [Anaeromyxobacteraceae bacterium]HTU02996.1 IS1634 family transposase [Candidatus Sulfotelmatobacter sp.]
MFLRCYPRHKDGKLHRYWSLVETQRVRGGRVVQRPVLYLGEINDSQQAAWRKTIEVFEDGAPEPRSLALFPDDRSPAVPDEQVVHIRLRDLRVRRPREWGACWLACSLYAQLGLDAFWAERLPPSRKGTRWDLILQALTAYRLIDPGSEWRLHREWFAASALPDLLGTGFEVAEIHKLYRCLDQLLAHKRALFLHLETRWRDLFNARYDVLLYDLTSTYFESDPPEDPHDKRRFGYSRDKRSDCVQVLIALIITPEGFPLAYEVLAGNVTDNRTLRLFLRQIERQYGKADRIWLMDRGIPTEATWAQMRASDPPVRYLVGTPKGRLSQLEAALLDQPWQQVRAGIEVKLLPHSEDVYVLARSERRVAKERAMRRKQLKRLWDRLHRLQRMRCSRDRLLLKLGAARQRWPAGARVVTVAVSAEGQLSFALDRGKLRQVRRREGRYLLRTNLTDREPAALWELYMRLVQVEEAFKVLKGDLAVRPIYHQVLPRIEAHIFVAFLAYALHATLRRRLRDLAPGLTSRAVLETFQTVQMVDVHLPTTDGREVILSRHTDPDAAVTLLLGQLRLTLPGQPAPRLIVPHAPAT